jgi:hypothetical protein
MINKWTKEKFEIFDSKHPEIYEMFKHFALQISKRRPYYSAKCVFHRVRWETDIGDKNAEFKIDDGWISHYSRKFIKEFPELDGLFKFRTRRNTYHTTELGDD